jgi:hypothetical protein
MSEPTYLLQWKGRQSGPFSLAQIRTQLGRGEISRMHQVAVDGGWQVLDEFLAQHPEETARRHADELRQREAELRREFETQLATERARGSEYSPQDEPPRSPLSHLLPKQPPPTFLPLPDPASEAEAESAPTRTSGLAIAALVLALCNFIPYVNFFSWILALVFGHTALGQMKRDPALTGRGLALAALGITYFLLVMGVTFLVLLLVNGQKIPTF